MFGLLFHHDTQRHPLNTTQNLGEKFVGTFDGIEYVVHDSFQNLSTQFIQKTVSATLTKSILLLLTIFAAVFITVLFQLSSYNASFLLGSSAHSLSNIFSLTINLSCVSFDFRYVQIQ
jgi:hypothetical protein